MTVVATWGGASDNSYISFTAANSYLPSAVVDPAAWTSASTTQREAALMEATRDIDSKQYIGQRYFPDQRLEFPRSSNTGDSWPYNFTSTATPNFDIEQARAQVAIEQATCYQALWILRNSGRNYHSERIASGVKSFSEAVGPISESATYGGGTIERLCPEALSIIAPWITGKRAVRG